jgi:hypothetical protein
MQGHITEQNRPPLINAYVAMIPVLRIPTSIAAAASTAKINKVFTGFSFPYNVPAIMIAMQTI